MTQDTLQIARLIGSRICHDIISPVGAIANGMELVALTGAAETPELELINASVSGATARIKFYRIALGMSSSEQGMGASEISRILAAFYADSRLTCDWAVSENSARDEVQAALLALLCLASALPMGGALTVARDADTWVVSSEGQQRISEPLWHILTGAPAPAALQPSEVQFAMLPECARLLGRTVSYDLGETGTTIRF
ncbi:histidine phosphotransferase family protein [Lentibacter sp.]|uniref:histidine phosphotransferase family protein n=1 Tax=Lentibacter sp. TaxID=2024994 RepID=UPI003F6AAFC1